MESLQLKRRARPLRVLLVDDEPDVRNFYRGLLEDAGMEVTAAGDARHGAVAATEREFDVAIVDERLPDVRGLALLRWLHRRRPAMKLILVSAYADWEMFMRGCGTGAFDVLSKARPASEFLRVIQGCV